MSIIFTVGLILAIAFAFRAIAWVIYNTYLFLVTGKTLPAWWF